MAVGTDIGKVYTGQQGTQTATVFNAPVAQQNALADAAEKRRKEAELNAAHKAAMRKLYETTPEWWSALDRTMNDRWNSILDEGARIMTNNNSDIFTSSDEAATEWRKKYTQFTVDSKQSMEFQKNDSKVRTDINQNPDKYTQESIVENIEWGYQNNPDDLLNGLVPPPTLKLKKPEADTWKFSKDLAATWKEANPNVLPNEQEATKYVEAALSSPNNSAIMQGYAQKFQDLPESEQKRLIAAGERGFRGKTGIEAGLHAMATEEWSGLVNPPEFDAAAWATKTASELQTEESVTDAGSYESQTRTKTEKLADKNAPTRRAKALLATKSWLLTDPKYAQWRKDNGIVDANGNELPFEEARQKAIAVLSKNVNDEVALDYSRTKELRLNQDAEKARKSKEEEDAFWADFIDLQKASESDSYPTQAKDDLRHMKAVGAIVGEKIPSKYTAAGEKGLTVSSVFRSPKNGAYLFRVNQVELEKAGKPKGAKSYPDYKDNVGYANGDVVMYQGEPMVIYGEGPQLKQVLLNMRRESASGGKSTEYNKPFDQQQNTSIDHIFIRK